MNNLEQLITERFDELPEVVQQYTQDTSWHDEVKAICQKHSLEPGDMVHILDEFVMFMLILQNKESLKENIKNILVNLPVPITALIATELLSLIPEEIQSLNASTLSKPIMSGATPENDAQGDTQDFSTESAAGVDVIPEEKEQEDRTTLGKNSLINSIEHPENAEGIEREAKEHPVFNPIASKLGGSTGAQEGTTPGTPHYGGNDPYREPIA